MVRYSLLRFAIFAIVLILLWFTGLRGWPLLILSAVASAIVSLIALQVPREKFARQIEDKVEAKRVKADAHRTAEDED
ncbi:DUF4229 domain-containing protein [Branchiibius cervicis]|uniref:DUF4229 domain-containing protein n=1 Tax=Branchiibius cervicis TaxID=908252 RepID=A0ABW2APQ9_9MICO